MPSYRRNFVPGGTYFFTAVVHQRSPLFHSPLARKILREAFEEVLHDQPFNIFAICLLPDHIHTVWTLPLGDCDYPSRWRAIKNTFTKSWLKTGGWEGVLSESRRQKGERGIWQRRFWEHTIEDADDLKRCVDYTHWNPRKHGLVARICDYPFSTFHRFVKSGDYQLNWGGTDPTPNWKAPDEWGE